LPPLQQIRNPTQLAKMPSNYKEAGELTIPLIMFAIGLLKSKVKRAIKMILWLIDFNVAIELIEKRKRG